MKKILVVLFLILSGCSSFQLSDREEKGTACLNKEEKDVSCIPVRLYLDPVRFHRLNHVERENTPEMPDLP